MPAVGQRVLTKEIEAMKIVWLHPHVANRNVASARVNAVLPAQYLSLKGHDASVVATLAEVEANQPDIVVAMSADQTQAVLNLRSKFPDLKVITFQSDGPVTSDTCLDLVNAIVLDGEYLAAIIPSRFLYKAVAIPDVLEVKRREPRKHPQQRLNLVYVGAGGNYFFAEFVINELRGAGWSVKTISDSSQATVPWNLDTVEDEILTCDVGVIPDPENLIVPDAKTYTNFRYKDNDRLVYLQGLGLPVVAAPMPSYLMYGKHNETCLFANDISQWMDRIQYLQDNPSCYNAIAEDGFNQAWGYAAPEVVGLQWEAAMVKACQPRTLRVV